MKRKIFTVLLICLIVFITVGCENEESIKASSALLFKQEYESLNGTTSISGKEIRTLDIPEDNPFIITDIKTINEMISEKETFVVYFGFASCPWCRSMLEQFIKSAKDNNIEKIYYVDVQNVRDVYKLDENNEPTKEKDGVSGYSELVENLSSVLSDYTLTSEDGVKIEVGEKRIYAPNVVAVVSGKAEKMVEGISEDLKDPYGELTNEMKEYTYNSFKCIWECISNDALTCQKNMC